MVSKEEVDKKWKLSEKTRMNISLPQDLSKWLDNNAAENWKLDKAARSKEITRIIIEAKRKSEDEI